MIGQWVGLLDEAEAKRISFLLVFLLFLNLIVQIIKLLCQLKIVELVVVDQDEGV